MGSEYVDLNGILTISGGVFNVYGGSSLSFWPYSDDASITMNNGTLDFKNRGIRLIYTGGHSFSENITGGTIRSTQGFEANRSEFTPEGGEIELYGESDGNISQVAGSHFHDITINKEIIVRSTFMPQPDHRLDEAEREVLIATVTTSTNIDINGDVLINSGTLNGADTMYVAGNWTNNKGAGGFNPGTGLVVFDGLGNTFLLSEETFNDITITKPVGVSFSLLHDMYTINSGKLTVSSGTLDINVYRAYIAGDAYQLTDGKILIAAGGTLEVGTGAK
jgi:hypothetical protein